MADELFSSRLVIKIDDLLKVHRVEKQRIEFKASWNTGGTSWQILHSITAFGNDFLNDNGGYIVIGVEDGPSDDGQVQVCGVPQQDLDKIQKQIQALCKGNIRPLYFPILSPEIYNEKHVLVIWATASDSGPHECRESAKGEFQFYEEDRKLLRLHRTKKDSYYWITIKHPSMTGLLGIQVRNQYFSIQFEL